MRTSGKKRSQSFIDDSDHLDALTNKAPKKTKTSAAVAASGKDDEGNPFWEVISLISLLIALHQTDHVTQLSNKRRVSVSQLRKNMCLVNLREYYEKDGKTLPGKKVQTLTDGRRMKLNFSIGNLTLSRTVHCLG